MKKMFLTALAIAPFAFADVLIEDFEKDDRVSLLSDKDVWFVYTDSADVGCATYFDYYEEKNLKKEYPEPCSKINTVFYDLQFTDWSFEPRKFRYENEDGEMVDTTMYFPLRTESPFTAADRKAEGPAVATLTVNETKVGGFFYEFGESQLMMTPTPTGYNIAEPNYWFVPYVAMGLKTSGNGVEYDLSKCKGISYKYRGEAHRFRADMSTITDNNYHAKTVSASKALSNAAYGGTTKMVQGFSTVTVLWSQLTQENWGVKKTFNASKVFQLVWELKGGNEDQNPYGSTTTNNLFDKRIVGISSDFGDLVIDDVTCVTTVASDTEIPVGPRSSSSARSSSSSSAKSSSSVTSSSSMEEPEAVVMNHALTSNISVQRHIDGLSVNVQNPAKVMFFDQQGRLMSATVELNAGSNFVPFGDMAKGMYVVVVKSNSESRSLKILIK